MSDAPIRAALEAAAKAIDAMPMPSVSGVDSILELSREIAWVGIAAFHRALASTAEPWFILGPYQYTRGASVALANVVERIGEERTQ